MKDISVIYSEIIKPLIPYKPNDGGKLTKKQLEKFNRDLTTLVIGIVIGADLSGDKIDKLAEQIKSLQNK